MYCMTLLMYCSVPSDATEQENELTPLCPGGDCLYFLSHTHTYTNRLVSRSQISGGDHAVSTITLHLPQIAESEK